MDDIGNHLAIAGGVIDAIWQFLRATKTEVVTEKTCA
jgi:hypothetical protein